MDRTGRFETLGRLSSRQQDPDFLLDDPQGSLVWNLFPFVLAETDRLGHLLLPALVEPWHPWRSEALNLVVAWDRLSEKALRATRPYRSRGAC